MPFYPSLPDLITGLVRAIEENGDGLALCITGGSNQSCSTYMTIGGMAVRVSDHAPRNSVSHTDYHVGLGSMHGDDSIDIHPVYERLVSEIDENDEVISSKYIECDKNADDAEHVGYRVEAEELKRAADAIIAAARNHTAENDDTDYSP